MNMQQIKRRKVFYIPGFDPFPARRYRELYRSNSQEQAAISDYTISQSALHLKDRFGWQVHARFGDQSSEAEIEVLVWLDLVKDTMRAGILATYLQLLHTAWIYVSTGALADVIELRKGPVIAALYPVGFLLGQGMIALAIAFIFGSILANIQPYLFWLGAVLIWPILEIFRRLDGRIFAYYLMQDYAFTAQFGGAYPPELNHRLKQFGQKVSQALAQDWDEVLVVGHSSGVHLAVSILAELGRRGEIGRASMPVGFLSLGHVVPMVTFLPNAAELRRDLQDLSCMGDVFWVDVSAPGDGCSFALCDLVAVSGLVLEDKTGPLVISATFTQTLSPERWKLLRWRFFRLHFQNLCAFDRPREYDYF
ncbi:hypothetical protein ACMAY7_06945 [Rhodobacteraceae bacterium nBUS_24]